MFDFSGVPEPLRVRVAGDIPCIVDGFEFLLLEVLRESRTLYHPDVDGNTDLLQLLLDNGNRLLADLVALVNLHFEFKLLAVLIQDTIAVGILPAGFLEGLFGLIHIIREFRQVIRVAPIGRNGLTMHDLALSLRYAVDNPLSVDGHGKRLAHLLIGEQRIGHIPAYEGISGRNNTFLQLKLAGGFDILLDDGQLVSRYADDINLPGLQLGHHRVGVRHNLGGNFLNGRFAGIIRIIAGKGQVLAGLPFDQLIRTGADRLLVELGLIHLLDRNILQKMLRQDIVRENINIACKRSLEGKDNGCVIGFLHLAQLGEDALPRTGIIRTQGYIVREYNIIRRKRSAVGEFGVLADFDSHGQLVI
ncbi:hypothetical protein D3C75_657070 [compost metagenome]